MKIRTRAFVVLWVITILVAGTVGFIIYALNVASEQDADRQRLAEIVNIHSSLWRSLVELKHDQHDVAVLSLPSIEQRLQAERSAVNDYLAHQATLLRDPEVASGLAAPYEPSPDLTYHELFAMNWSLISQAGPTPLRKRQVRLEDLVDQPLILYERGSTGRQHVLDAFNERGLVPRVALETTSTETIVSMVEAGLGVSIVPLLPSGAVTRGRQVEVRSLEAAIRPIHSGVLVRKNEKPSRLTAHLLNFTRSKFTQT